MTVNATRRDLLSGVLSLPVLSMLPHWASRAMAAEPALKLGPAEPFDFDRLAARAKALAGKPFVPYQVRNGKALDRIDYDAHWKIKFRPEKALW